MAGTRNGGRKNYGNEEGRENKDGNEERREIMTGIRKGGRKWRENNLAGMEIIAESEWAGENGGKTKGRTNWRE